MILHVTSARVTGSLCLWLRFDDGTEKTVDVRPLLQGPVLAALLDPSVFARVTVDPIARTVVWPNGADLAPEALRALPDISQLQQGDRAASHAWHP